MSDRPRHSSGSPRTTTIRNILKRPHIQARLIQLKTTIFNTGSRNVKISHIRLHIIRERQNLTLIPRLRHPIRLSRRLDHKTDDIPVPRTLIPNIPILRPLARIQLNVRQRQPNTTITTIPHASILSNGLNAITYRNRIQLRPIMHLNRTIRMEFWSHIGHNTGLNPGQNQTINILGGSTGRPRLQPRTRSLTMSQTRIINRDHNIIITGRIRHIHSHRLRNGIRVRTNPRPRAHHPTMRLDSDGNPVNRRQRYRTTIPDTLRTIENSPVGREQERVDDMPIIISRVVRDTVQNSQRMQNNITHKSFLTINHSDVDTSILPTKEDSRATSLLSSPTSSMAFCANRKPHALCSGSNDLKSVSTVATRSPNRLTLLPTLADNSVNCRRTSTNCRAVASTPSRENLNLLCIRTSYCNTGVIVHTPLKSMS